MDSSASGEIRMFRRAERSGIWVGFMACLRTPTVCAECVRGQPGSVRVAPSGTFLARAAFGGIRAGPGSFLARRSVLPMSACWGVGVELEQVEQGLLVEVGVG